MLTWIVVPPFSKFAFWHNLWVMTFWNNFISHAKRFHFKSQTHIEHLSAEMNTLSAWNPLLLAKAPVKPQLHCHDFGPRQSYDSPRFVKSGCIGMILSSAVAPSWYTGVNRRSTVVILEESWWFGNLEDNATTSLNSSGWIVLDCGRGLSRSSTVAGSGSFLVASW